MLFLACCEHDNGELIGSVSGLHISVGRRFRVKIVVTCAVGRAATELGSDGAHLARPEHVLFFSESLQPEGMRAYEALNHD